MPAYAQTAQFWRDLGYKEPDIRSIMSDIRYAQASAAIAQQAAQQAATSPAEPPRGGTPDEG